MNVLFVCTGNTCRSPMAEHLFRSWAKRLGRDVDVKSAGIAALEGEPFPTEARTALRREGVDHVEHRAQNISAGLIEWADLILTMEQRHKRILVERFPSSVKKTRVLNEYAETGTDAEGIIDPYGGTQSEYDRTLEQIKRALAQILKKI